MSPVKEKWSAEYSPSFDEVEIHLPEDWEGAEHLDPVVHRKRRSAGLWTAIASLAVLLAVAAAYGYSVLTSQNAQLTWLPSLAKSISAVRTRTDGIEASLKQWSGKQENLAAKVQTLDAGWDARLNAVRQHAAALVASTYQKEQAELIQRTAALNAQIAEMSTRQQADHVRMAQLEQELSSTRQELASVQESSNRDLATLQQEQASSQSQIEAINNTLSTDEVDFEAARNQDAEIVPGVSLHLTDTDVAHQKYGAWIWLAASRRRIWVHGQNLETPLVFYPQAGGEAYELVVTRVKPKEVAGYMLVPGNSNTQSADNAKTSAGNSPGSL